MAVSQEGTGRDWWVGGRMASTRSAVAVEEDQYAEGANTTALHTPRLPNLMGSVA